MAEQYRKFFREQVKFIIQKDPNKDSLLELLKLTWPALTESHVLTPPLRGKAYKRVKDSLEEIGDDDADELYAGVESFYEKCMENIKNQKKQKMTHYIPLTSPSGDEIPRTFYVKDTWKFLDVEEVYPLVNEIADDEVAALAAVHCINARGAIAHRNETELHYSIDSLQGDSDDKRTVRSIFDLRGGGTKILDSIEAICEELIMRGPVVSTSFVLDEAFAAKHEGLFSKERIGKNHEIVLVGWKQSEDGEFWIAKAPFTGETDDDLSSGGLISIPVRQFGVDGVCWAPKATFKDMNWQDGPYWDRPLSADIKKDWYTWKTMWFSCSGKSLQILAKCLGMGFPKAAKKKTRFVIRDENERANSRACYLTNVEWNEESEKWKVTVNFTS